jgi:hypothetical protein
MFRKSVIVLAVTIVSAWSVSAAAAKGPSTCTVKGNKDLSSCPVVGAAPGLYAPARAVPGEVFEVFGVGAVPNAPVWLEITSNGRTTEEGGGYADSAGNVGPIAWGQWDPAVITLTLWSDLGTGSSNFQKVGVTTVTIG